MTKTVHPNILRGRVHESLLFGKALVKTSNGVLKFKILLGILFIKYVPMRIASPQRYLGALF